MRCDMCPLWPSGDDVCPGMDGEYGMVHKDGVCGCRHPWNWINKREQEYEEYIGIMGARMGKKMMERSESTHLTK